MPTSLTKDNYSCLVFATVASMASSGGCPGEISEADFNGLIRGGCPPPVGRILQQLVPFRRRRSLLSTGRDFNCAIFAPVLIRYTYLSIYIYVIYIHTTHAHTRICTHTHTHTHTYTHTYIHTYIYTFYRQNRHTHTHTH